MKVSLDVSALKNLRWRQAALRFGLGGLVTAATGLIARQCGPVLGGLFLAFPAIFPAGVTLIAQRERKKKEQKGLHGTIRGQQAAALDAAGTALGALALMLFAAFVWRTLPKRTLSSTLLVGALLWLTFSVAFWWVRKKHRRNPRSGRVPL